MTNRAHRDLTPFPLDEAMSALSGAKPALIITMGTEQWDPTLAAAYNAGWILLEIDRELPVRAYRRREQ
jgi:hypothetical protein